jgi:outer membrane protein TolC
MKKHLITILSILLTAVFPAVATFYPSLDNQYEIENKDEIVLDQEALQTLIQQWQDDSLPTLAEAEKNLRLALKEGNPDLEQLQSLYRMQQQQMQYQQSEQDFKLGLSSQPLYSLSRSINLTTTGGYDLSNSFGVGASISKKLGTGAIANLSTSQNSTLTKNSTGSSWTWTHSPSASLTLSQPLWVGDGLIDTNYSEKQLEKFQISSENAKLTYEQLLEALVAQGNNQLSALQGLKESRFLLGEQLTIEQTLLKDEKKDLEEGRISRNAYEARQLGINQLRYSLTEIEMQIETLQNSLATLWGSNDYPKQVIVDSELLKMLPSIVFDKEQLVKILLEQDYTYAQAMGNLRSAELDAMLKSPSDAPMLNLSFQVAPSYTPSTGADFFTSFDDLISDGTPIFSFSIGFSASDFSRSTTRLSSALADESVLQAKLEVEKARDDLELKVEEIQRNIEGLILNLSIGLYEFERRTNDIEVERIRFEIGLADESSIKTKEISWYDSAFMVLQNLRELDLIALDLNARGMNL